MKNILRFSMVILALTLAAISTADAKKKTAKQLAIDKCDGAFAGCIAQCDELIDINTQVRDCNNKCAVRQSYCLLKAGVRMQVPESNTLQTTTPEVQQSQ